MKSFIFIIISLLITVFPVFSADLNATVEEINGKVDYKIQNGDWTPLKIGDVLGPGDSISTGFNAKAVLVLGDTSVLVANALTRLTLSELVEKEGTVVTDLFLDVGNVRAEVHSSDEVSNDFQVRNANSTASVRGTVLDVEILGDGQGMKVMAWDGMAVVTDLKTGRKARVGEQKKKKAESKSGDEEGGDDEGEEGEEGPGDDEQSGDGGDNGDGGESDSSGSSSDFGAPPEPPAQIAAAPLLASGTGSGMVSSMSSAIAASTVTVSTKPPAPTSISTGGGSSVSTETAATVTTAVEEVITTITSVPTTSSVNIQIVWPE